MFSIVVSTFFCFFVARCALKFWNGLQSVDYVPGMRPPLAPMTLFGAIVPTFWWNPGPNWQWEWRKTAYFNRTYDVISVVPWLSGTASYYVSSMEVIRQLLGNERNTPLTKPRILTRALWLWGDNLFSANHDEWKRHRRIVAPSFTPKTYSLVWNETRSLYKEMCTAEGWDNETEIFVTDITRHPLRFAFIIIARCGFGLPMSWVEETNDKEDLSCREALMTVLQTTIARLIIPRWAFKLPIKALQDMEHAWDTLGAFMQRFVEAKKRDLAQYGDTDQQQRGDIFSRLVAASDGARKYGLDEQEVIGNTFTLMFAGHESTSVAISATFGYLAIHQEDQEKAYLEIQKAIPKDREPTPEDLSNTPYIRACFDEALRLLPSGAILTRDMPEDVIINVTHPNKTAMTLKKGSRVIIDMIAAHHDPHLFPEPQKFRPERWLGQGDRDITMFGVGPRACIGQKFAMAEAMCFLIMLLRDWKLDVELKDGETRDAYEERVMIGGRVGLAFGVMPFDMKLTRRD